MLTDAGYQVTRLPEAIAESDTVENPITPAKEKAALLLREYAAYQLALEYSRARGDEGLTLTIVLEDIMAAIESWLEL